MKNVIIILILLPLVSCHSARTEHQYKDEQQWIFAFKASAFSSCLKHNGVVIGNDASPSLQFEALVDIKAIDKTDSLAKSFSEIIEERAAWLGEDFKGYKAIVNGCLSFYESKELDSVTRVEYKKFREEHKYMYDD